MELIVNIPDSLHHSIQEQIDDGSYAHQRELLVAALEYFLDVKKRIEMLERNSEEGELSDEERSEYQSYVRTRMRADLLKINTTTMEDELE